MPGSLDSLVQLRGLGDGLGHLPGVAAGGVIDKDYYGNPDNDGHIMFAFYNIKEEDIEIKKGEAIGQALFQKYLITDDDKAEGKRMGGFGSTRK